MLDSLSDDYIKSKGWISCERSGTSKFCVVKKINCYRCDKWERRIRRILNSLSDNVLNPKDEEGNDASW